MNTLPEPLFQKDLKKISWIKIYDREYGVQYSEVAVALLAFAPYHFPKTSFSQVVVPGAGKNTTFYIDSTSWKQLVAGLNIQYTADVKKLEKYEKQFITDGNSYLKLAKKTSMYDMKKLSNEKLLTLFLDYQDKKYRYSAFAWSAFILNNSVADHATEILDVYIKKYNKEKDRQTIVNSLFKPSKLAAVMNLQRKVEKHNGKLTSEQITKLYEQYKWLPCLDIQNNPWTKTEFKKHIKSFTKQPEQTHMSFEELMNELRPSIKDVAYLRMAQRFVYIKDARDDFRRESVYYAANLWQELGRRMGIPFKDITYLLDAEIIVFLKGTHASSKKVIAQRKKGFVIYIDKQKNLLCIEGDAINEALTNFNLLPKEEIVQKITGRIASKGKATGKVAIVKGVKDLSNVKKGSILVAVTTHPDYIAAMRKAVAIVTDEGGITSHAAIVSREYGIPCIVGTKNATKILRDGNMVAVDADKGIVTLLS